MTKKEKRLKEEKKKMMTKKELEQSNKLQRSEFASFNLSGQVFADGKGYDRKREKRNVQKEIRNYCW